MSYQEWKDEYGTTVEAVEIEIEILESEGY